MQHEAQTILDPLAPTYLDQWALKVLEDLPSFLADHAHCERKASNQAISLSFKFAAYPHIAEPMIALAREELAHFHEVYLVMKKRGFPLDIKSEKDEYIDRLTALVRHGEREYLLDRLLVFALVEARGCEKFCALADRLKESEPDLSIFYDKLGKCEAAHYKIFTQAAKSFYGSGSEHRLQELIAAEKAICDSLAPRAAVH